MCQARLSLRYPSIRPAAITSISRLPSGHDDAPKKTAAGFLRQRLKSWEKADEPVCQRRRDKSGILAPARYYSKDVGLVTAHELSIRVKLGNLLRNASQQDDDGSPLHARPDGSGSGDAPACRSLALLGELRILVSDLGRGRSAGAASARSHLGISWPCCVSRADTGRDHVPSTQDPAGPISWMVEIRIQELEDALLRMPASPSHANLAHSLTQLAIGWATTPRTAGRKLSCSNPWCAQSV